MTEIDLFHKGKGIMCFICHIDKYILMLWIYFVVLTLSLDKAIVKFN